MKVAIRESIENVLIQQLFIECLPEKYAVNMMKYDEAYIPVR